LSEIQNEREALAKMVSDKICVNVRNAGIHSILADETKDCSKKEQLSLVVRYDDVDTATPFGHFLSYAQVTSLNAESRSSYIQV